MVSGEISSILLHFYDFKDRKELTESYIYTNAVDVKICTEMLLIFMKLFYSILRQNQCYSNIKAQDFSNL